jgi:hypothetical protein
VHVPEAPGGSLERVSGPPDSRAGGAQLNTDREVVITDREVVRIIISDSGRKTDNRP